THTHTHTHTHTDTDTHTDTHTHRHTHTDTHTHTRRHTHTHTHRPPSQNTQGQGVKETSNNYFSLFFPFNIKWMLQTRIKPMWIWTHLSCQRFPQKPISSIAGIHKIFQRLMLES